MVWCGVCLLLVWRKSAAPTVGYHRGRSTACQDSVPSHADLCTPSVVIVGVAFGMGGGPWQVHGATQNMLSVCTRPTQCLVSRSQGMDWRLQLDLPSPTVCVVWVQYDFWLCLTIVLKLSRRVHSVLCTGLCCMYGCMHVLTHNACMSTSSPPVGSLPCTSLRRVGCIYHC